MRSSQFYEISNTGLVRRIGNDVLMSFFIQNQGYAVASLAVQAKSSMKRTIHRLVALAFLPNDAHVLALGLNRPLNFPQG